MKNAYLQRKTHHQTRFCFRCDNRNKPLPALERIYGVGSTMWLCAWCARETYPKEPRPRRWGAWADPLSVTRDLYMEGDEVRGSLCEPVPRCFRTDERWHPDQTEYLNDEETFEFDYTLFWLSQLVDRGLWG